MAKKQIDFDYYDSEDVELTSGDKKILQDEQNVANNEDNIRAAANVAIATKNPYATAAGTAVKVADQASDGKSTEFLADTLNNANKVLPGGHLGQAGLNFLGNSGLANKVGTAAGYYNSFRGGNGQGAEEAADAADKTADAANKTADAADKANKTADTANKTADAADKANKATEGGPNGSPSATDKNPTQQGQAEGNAPSEPEEGKKSPITGGRRNKDNGEQDEYDTTSNPFKGNTLVTLILLSIAPLLICLVVIIVMVSSVVGSFTTFNDALGISAAQGNTAAMNLYHTTNKDEQAFYERVLKVKDEFLEDGKSVDALKVVAVYHVMKDYDAKITYSYMTKARIEEIANAMFDEDGFYSDEVFEKNLIEKIIPKYLPKTTAIERATIAKQVFEYIKNYNSFMGKNSGSCSGGVGTCTYDIKGFYIDGSNRTKEINVSDLYVRLMQCGSYNGHNAGGTWGQPLAGEELVPFEKYVLGVAYQEIGPSAPEQAFKAQMVAARSFILARPTQMGGWRTLKEENGKWILQVASCTADQVYCDPDKGCSAENGDGQWKQVHSGTGHGKTLKGPLAADSPLRQYATDVQGEVLVNKNGNIVLTDYTNTESMKFTSLANSGYDYKQILMQVYNNKYPNAGISDISKASCGSCTASGDYANWKQYEGDWTGVQLGGSGKTIKQIGCLATSLAIQVAKSGTATNVNPFNPGTFVEALSKNGAFGSSGALLSYDSVEKVAPGFKYQGYVDLKGMSKDQKLNAIKNIVNQSGVYAVAEVKGDTGQHWVAIDSIDGSTIKMMDPGSSHTDMWDTYGWNNTSRIVYYKVG